MVWYQAATALSPGVPLSELRHTAWTEVDGVPDAIGSLVQSSDGFLWIGSPTGLTRFDGVHFEKVALEQGGRLSSGQIYSLHAPASGGLWIGFTFGGAAFLRDGKLKIYTDRDGLPQGSVKSFAEDRRGMLWVGTTTGLARFENEHWRKVGPSDGFPESRADLLMTDSAGALWVIVASRAILRRVEGDSEFKQVVVGSPAETGAPLRPSIAESPDGAVWFAWGKSLERLEQNAPTGRARTSDSGILFDREGALWASQWSGSGGLRLSATRLKQSKQIQRDEPGLEVPRSLDAPSTEQSEWTDGPLLEDREGNVWIASRSTLHRFAERNVERFPSDGTKRKALQTPLVALMAGADGSVWIGGDFPPYEVRNHSVIRTLGEIRSVLCSIRGDDGALWIGNREGIWKQHDGVLQQFALPKGIADVDVQAMTLDSFGTLWVSIVRNGVFTLRNGAWVAYGGHDALPRATAVSLATDARGRVWLGYTEGRVAVVDGDRVRVFGQPQSRVGNVTSIYGRRSSVWIGGELGLARVEGDAIRELRPAKGMSFDGITGIVETANGDLWVNANSGLVHLSAAQLEAAMTAGRPVDGETFGTSDGVLGSSARLRPIPTTIEASDGRLWFVRNIGVYSIDPAHLHRNPLPPPVVLQAVTVGSSRYAASGSLKLPAGTTSMRIDYVAPSLTAAEKVRYRYQLEGVDREWQDVITQRQAFYANLGPGAHRFRVIAANNDGVWNETGASIDVVIPPTFVQTKTFVFICILGAVAIVWAAVRFRVRQVSARMRLRFAERLAERERIARELHDTLLQGTQGLILRFQAVANQMAGDDARRAMIDQALERADRVMIEGRDRLLDLRASNEPTSDLVQSLTEIGEEFGRDSGTSFEVVIAGQSRPLRPGVRDEAYRIGREALLNAFRHAEARVIDVRVSFDPHLFRLRVRDDGIGVDASMLEARTREGHWGIQGMRERAKKVGGSLEIVGTDTVGTAIELSIPAAVAYLGQEPKPRWFPLLRQWAAGR